MLLLDFRSTTVPQPVPEFLTQGRPHVSEQLQVEWIGMGYDAHESNAFVFAVAPADSENKELYAVDIWGSPEEPINKAFVSTAKKLLSFDTNEPYPQTHRLDYDTNAGPPRPEVVRALTVEITKDNGSGKSVPHFVPV